MESNKLSKLIFICALGFFSCAKESSPGSPAEPAQAPTPGASQGGADMGGCNGVQSRCFEDFILRVDEKPEFKEFVMPVIKKLKKIQPRMAADMLHLLRERSWYFVPVELSEIPSQYLGVGFKTEQIVLQTKREIWVSTKHYDRDQITPKSRGLLLLHELIMGIRFMEFQTSLDKCYAGAATQLLDDDSEAGVNQYRVERAKCRAAYPNPLDTGKALKVTEQMNVDIRELTHLIRSRIDEIDADELNDWIRRHEFRAYD